MASLDDLLALLPDNTVGAIDAADLREVVTELWNYTMQVQATQNQLVVESVSTLQAADAEIDARLDALESTVYAGGLRSDGSLAVGPAGWSATSTQAGLYTVTHNLGTLDYAVVITPLAKTVDGWSAAVEATTENSFTFGTYSDAHAGLHGVYSNFVVVIP